MKKNFKSVMAILLTSITLLSSCVADEKDNEEDEIKNDLSFLYIKAERSSCKEGTLPANPDWAINTNVFAKASKAVDSDAESTGIKGKISDLFKDAQRRTTIYGFSDNEFMSITYNGRDAKDIPFIQEIGGRVSGLLFEYLETGTLTEEMKGMFDFDALIIYKSEKKDDASTDNIWFSYDCTINPSPLQVKSVSYIQGTFSARMMNKAGDTFMFIPGAFSCLGW